MSVARMEMSIADGEHGTRSPSPSARPIAAAAAARPDLGLFHAGCRSGQNGSKPAPRSSASTPPIQAVGEGDHGRLGLEQQQRYTDAEAEPMFGQPYTSGAPQDQAAARSHRSFPSPDFDKKHEPSDTSINQLFFDLPGDLCVRASGQLRRAPGRQSRQRLRASRPDLGTRSSRVRPTATTRPITDRRLKRPARASRASTSRPPRRARPTRPRWTRT